MATQFTAMTWNVENLFPAGHPLSSKRSVTPAEYQNKLSVLADVIAEIAPDVLALQELGGSDAQVDQTLADLQERLQGQFAARAYSQHPDRRGIRVGFLSRHTIAGQEDLLDLAAGELNSTPDWQPAKPITRLGRGALAIEVHIGNGPKLRLMTAHLKSKLVTYPGGRFAPKDEDERARGQGLALLRRTAETVAIRSFMNQAMGAADGAHSIVLGDMNDEPRAATSQLLLGPEDTDASSGDKFDAVRLYNLTDSIPMRGGEDKDKRFLNETERYSRIYKGRRELIDHIMVSKSLLGESADLAADRWRVTEVRSRVDLIARESVSDSPTERLGRAIPDHAPVYARFELS